MADFCAGKPACGQAHPACGACSNADGGASGVPVINTPINGANVTLDATNQVTFTWTAAAKADKYEVQIYPNKTGAPNCTHTDTYCNANVTGTSVTHTLALTSYSSWTFRVRSINDTCVPAGTASAWRSITFNPIKTFTANLLMDDGGTSAVNVGTGKCEQSGTPVPAPDTVLATLRISRPAGANIDAVRSGNVFTANVPYVSNLRATLNRQSSVQCKCPGSCSYDGLSASDFNYNFYVGATTSSPWWQTQNGLTFAGAETGDAIISRIPDACSPDGSISASAQTTTGANFASYVVDGNLSTKWIGQVASYNRMALDMGSSISLQGMSIRFGAQVANESSTFNIAGRVNATDANTVIYQGTAIPIFEGRTNNITFPVNTPAYRYYQIGLTTASNYQHIYEITPVYKASCAASFSLRDAANTTNSSGIAITGGGDIDVAAPSSSRYGNLRADTTGASLRAIGSEYKGTQEDYDYFYNKYSMGAAPTTDFTGALPAGNPTNGRAYFRSGNTTLSGGWAVPANRSLVIFVDGDLTIGTPITVARGGFLAFIVSGDITFSNTLGHASPATTTSNVQGVFIGDRVILEGGRAGGDLKFVGEGTFVGWSDVQMLREYASAADNTTNPTEVFRYRPDFLFNTPDRMKQPNIVWQETN